MRIGNWEIRRADDPEVRIPGDLRMLKLQPGDRFLLRFDGPVSAEQAARIKTHCNDFLERHGARLLVLSGGVEVDVVGESQ